MLNETGLTPLILDYTSWQDGQTGSVGAFGQNGSTTENYRVLGTDPWGKETVLWEARADATSGADGGWNSSYFPIDNIKTHRVSTWIRRPVLGNGSYYFGTNGGGAAVLNLSNLAVNTNPYFTSGGMPTSRLDWHLYVGHVHPVGYTGPVHVDTGIYNVNGDKVASASDFVCQAGTTSLRHRSYLYYSTDITTRQQWVYPRFDVCDGYEPTISDLVSGYDSNYIEDRRNRGPGGHPFIVEDKGVKISRGSEVGPADGLVAWYPLNGNTHDYTQSNDGTGTTVTATSRGYLFDGATSEILLPNPDPFVFGTGDFTVSMWANPDLIESLDTLCEIGHYTNGILFRPTSGSIQFYLSGSSISASHTRELGRWDHYIAMRQNGTASILVNGIQLISASMTGNITMTTIPSSKIGSSTHTPSQRWNGYIDDFRIYNRALSAEEISILYEITNPEINNRMKQSKDCVYIRGEFQEA